jgi:ankyrin repeat protein
VRGALQAIMEFQDRSDCNIKKYEADQSILEVHVAAYKGDTLILSNLIVQDQDGIMKDMQQRSLFHHAACNPCIEVLEMLFERFSDPQNETLLEPDADGYTPLHWAIRFGRQDNIRFLLRNGADVNANEGIYDWSPVQLAFFHGYANTVAILLENGSSDRRRSFKAGAEHATFGCDGCGMTVQSLQNDS